MATDAEEERKGEVASAAAKQAETDTRDKLQPKVELTK